MPPQPKVLLTIITEAILESTLVEEITRLGARGYTISDSRGRGVHGLRTGNWRKEGNIRIEVIGDAALCEAIIARLQAEYERDYGLLMFTCPVEVRN